jgi:hypothetical protein
LSHASMISVKAGASAAGRKATRESTVQKILEDAPSLHQGLVLPPDPRNKVEEGTDLTAHLGLPIPTRDKCVQRAINTLTQKQKALDVAHLYPRVVGQGLQFIAKDLLLATIEDLDRPKSKIDGHEMKFSVMKDKRPRKQKLQQLQTIMKALRARDQEVHLKDVKPGASSSKLQVRPTTFETSGIIESVHNYLSRGKL